MAQLDYVLQAFTAFVDGFGKAGTGEKFTAPKIKKKLEAFRGGGMQAERQVAMGYEKIEFDLSLNAFDPQVINKAGLYANKDVGLSCRGYLDGDGQAKHTAIWQMRGECVEIDPGDWDAGKKAVLKAKFALTMVKLTIDQGVIFEIDIENGVYAFDGLDAYTNIRAALGL